MNHTITADYDLTLKTLEFVNFMAFKTLKLDFDGKDIIGVLAQYASDKTRSNRSGKTAILEGIRYNLTGESRAKFDKDLIFHGMKYMEVICTYTDGEKDYVVRRGVDAKGKGLTEIDWVTNVSEAQREINKLFGISADDFDLTNFFKQADIMGFMGKKPAEKTAFLMQYIENQHWAQKEALANADRAVVKQKIRDNDNLRSTLERSLEVDISLEGMKDDLVASLEAENETLTTIKNEHAEITGKATNQAKTRKDIVIKINKSKEVILGLEDDIESAQEKLTNINSLEKVIKESQAQVNKTKVTKTLKQVNDEKAVIQSKVNLLNNQVSSASKNQGVCPILKSDCSRISFSKVEVEKFKNEVSEHQANLSDLEAEIEAIDEFKELTVALDKAKTKLGVLLDNKPDVEALTKKLDKEKTDLAKSRAELAELTKADYAAALADLNEQIQQQAYKVEGIQKKVNGFDVRIQTSKNTKIKIDKLVEENEKLKKELSLLNYTCRMFSKSGIPSGEIENAFGEIEEKINYCLANLNAGLSISFSADRETGDKEPICQCGHEFVKGFKGKDCPECAEPRQYKRKDEINFSVVEGDKEQSFDLDSGGGKQIICYAVKIALTYFKRRMSKCRLNMLFLDEIDSALDPYLANQIISSVTNFLTNKLGFKQIILVSHKEQIKNSMPHMIKVTRHTDYSTARFV